MVARVTVTLPEDILARLDSVAADEGVSRSDVVREAAARYLTQRESAQVARAREAAAMDGVSWLESLAAREPKDARPSVEILRELRDGRVLGETLCSDDDREAP